MNNSKYLRIKYYKLVPAVPMVVFKSVKNVDIPVPTEVNATMAPAAISPTINTYSVIVAPVIFFFL